MKSAAGIAATILGCGVIGALLGVVYANRAVRGIADAVRAEFPSDPLDGLPLIWLGYVGVGFTAGMCVGAAVTWWRAQHASPRG